MSGFLGPLLATDIQSFRGAGLIFLPFWSLQRKKIIPPVKCYVPSIIQDKPFNLPFPEHSLLRAGASSTSGMYSHVKEIITRPSFRLRKEEKFTQINFSIEDKIRLVPASAKMLQPSRLPMEAGPGPMHALFCRPVG